MNFYNLLLVTPNHALYVITIILAMAFCSDKKKIALIERFK